MIQEVRVDSFKRYFLISAALHVLVVLFFTVQSVVFPSESIELAAAIKVDIVDLPDKISEPAPVSQPMAQPDQPTPKVEAEIAPLPKAKPEEKAIDLDKKQKDALARLNQDSALDKIKKELEKEQKKDQKVDQNKVGQLPTYKGNQLAAGTELRGLARAQHDQYVGSIESIIRRNWALPEWLSSKNLKAQVRIKMNARGEVIEMKLLRPSGNPSFDENVLVTVQKSSPLPAPPERLELIIRNDGIVLGFPE